MASNRTGLLKAYTTASEVEAPIYAAFTAAELGEMLPAFVAEDFDLACYKHSFSNTWAVEYSYPIIGGGIRRFMNVKIESETEAKAKADMLIWLLEQGHEPVAECNSRLAAA